MIRGSGNGFAWEWIPGVYPGVPFEDYVRIEAINASSLVYARQSMGHVRAALDGKLGCETKATKLGSLVHTLVLEPLTFDGRYVIEPDDLSVFRTGKGEISKTPRSTSAYSDWVKAQAPRIVLTAEENAEAALCAAAVLEHADARRLLTADGVREVVIVWVDQATGVRCKIRVDWLGDFVADLKTTASVSEFEWSIGNYDYDVKGAFYRRGVAAATGTSKDVALVAVETSGYPAVRASILDPSDLDEADTLIDKWLEDVRICEMSGHWPGPESPAVWRCRRRRSPAEDVGNETW